MSEQYKKFWLITGAIIVFSVIVVLFAATATIATTRINAHRANLEDVRNARNAFIIDFRELPDNWSLARHWVLTYVIDNRPYEIVSPNYRRLQELINVLDPNWFDVSEE